MNRTPAAMIADTSVRRNTKESFARQSPGCLIRDRATMAVTVATRTGDTKAATPASDPVAIAEAQRRFAICKACEHSSDDGFACDLYHDCCFGRFRSGLDNHCPQQKW